MSRAFAPPGGLNAQLLLPPTVSFRVQLKRAPVLSVKVKGRSSSQDTLMAARFPSLLISDSALETPISE